MCKDIASVLCGGYHSIYCMCLPTVPSMADSWLFSRPWSGFGGSGGGVFICLTSDSSTAPAEVRWQEKKTQNKTQKHERSNPLDNRGYNPEMMRCV